MKVAVRVVPRASRNLIKEEAGMLKVYLTKPAEDGQANNQLIDLLSEYFDVAKSKLRIIQGGKTRNKFIEIDD